MSERIGAFQYESNVTNADLKNDFYWSVWIEQNVCRETHKRNLGLTLSGMRLVMSDS